MKIYKILNLFFMSMLLSCCTLTPKYKTPEVDVPLKMPSNPSKAKITTIPWQDFFQSPDLQRVVELALENNNDLKTANLNIELAQAIHGIERSNLLPKLNVTGSEIFRNSTKRQYQGNLAMATKYQANLGMVAYEVDFFGKLRSLKASALENFLATKEASNVIKITLISETVNSYAQLLMDSEILKIADDNLATQTERYKLINLRYDHNLDSKEKLLEAQASLEDAKIVRETYAKLVAQDKNALMALIGVFAEKSLPEDKAIDDIKINEAVLESFPSESLLSRPDIKQAEHYLKSANANIGAARAAFFPSITLTGSYGYASNDLSNLFSSGNWIFMPQINLPIFSGGRNTANLKIANIQKKIEIIQYQKTIQTAFRESMDQLSERESALKNLQSYNQILQARQKSYEILELKNKNGISNRLQVLEAKISLLSAKQYQVIMKKDYIVNLINLYKVFGGGSELNLNEF